MDEDEWALKSFHMYKPKFFFLQHWAPCRPLTVELISETLANVRRPSSPPSQYVLWVYSGGVCGEQMRSADDWQEIYFLKGFSEKSQRT